MTEWTMNNQCYQWSYKITYTSENKITNVLSHKSWVIYTYHALMIWEPENKPNKPSKSRSLKLEEKNLHVNWAYENNKSRVRRRRGNLLRGRRNQQLEGVCHLLEYGYQQQQLCKIPCFCISDLLNESSPPFSLLK